MNIHQLLMAARPTRCVEGRLFRHDPQHDDPDLETDVGACPECNGKGCDCEDDDAEPDVLSELWEAVNALGGWRPDERNYDQGFIDGISAALDEIEKAQAGDLDPRTPKYGVAP
jgi:hypothetical protein